MATSPDIHPQKQKIDKVIQDMSEELRQQYEELSKLWENQTGAEMTGHYEIGARIAKIDDDRQTYGEKAVEDLARALRLNKATLYDYAAVARRWSAEEINKVRDRKGILGRPLSWSHLVELSRVKKDSTREKLFKQALNEGLAVRELARRVKEHLPSKPLVSLPAGKAVLRDLKKTAAWLELLPKNLGEQIPALCQRLQNTDPSELTPKHLAQLKQVIKYLKELKKSCGDHDTMLWESKQVVEAAASPIAAGNNDETAKAVPSDEKRPEHENPAPAGNNGKAQPATRNGRKPKGRQAEAPETAGVA